MDIRIEAQHLEPDNSLQAMVIEKVEKLEHVYDRIQDCRVILKTDPSGVDKNKVVEIIINVPQRHRLFVKEQEESFDLASTLAVADMKKQLIKHKATHDTKHEGRHAAPDELME